MRSALLFTTILLFAIVPFSNPVTADGLDENSGITISASFDNSTEMTTLTVSMPVTDNATLLDELKSATFSINRHAEGDWPSYIEAITSEMQFCTPSTSNAECSGATFEIEHYASPFANSAFEYYLNFHNSYVVSNAVLEEISLILAVENLTGIYGDDLTTLSWDYPPETPMNHSIMIYSHDSPATRENWNSMAKTIVSSSIPAGTTSYEINYSGDLVEREIYYSVTLLYETSEDTRFLGNNTLVESVKEDNKAPIFLGELQASFNPDTDITTIDWGEGVSGDDLSINIYRSEVELLALDSNQLLATVDSSTTYFDLQIPINEHQQSWYAISLIDLEGNEITTLTDSSPVAGPVVESTTSAPTITNLAIDRNVDGSITLSWVDGTDDVDAIARVWRSTTGSIESLENAEELASMNASNEQFTHTPINSVDEAWYAITFDGRWGSSEISWHEDTLTPGVNSMINPVRETEVIDEDSADEILARVQSTTEAGSNLTDGASIFLGTLHEGDTIMISTSRAVDNISCNPPGASESTVASQSDWILSFSANQSAEMCLGTIIDGEYEIGFSLTWNFVEEVGDNDAVQDSYDEGFEDGQEFANDQANESVNESGTAAQDSNEDVSATNVILAIAILILLVYLLVMMRSPDYKEEE
tara:strand:+ start:1825 stop:3771 length:1947 start_codon:yes stop_codon:yes gene_type:complete